MNVKPPRRRLALVAKQPAKQAELARRLVARQPLLERGERVHSVGLRRIGFDRAGGNQRLILCTERGGVSRQHGPLSASSEQKLQALNGAGAMQMKMRVRGNAGYCPHGLST